MRGIVNQDTEKDKALRGFQVHELFWKLSSCLPPSNPGSQVFKVFGVLVYFSWHSFYHHCLTLSFPVFKINSAIQIIATKLFMKQNNWQSNTSGIIFHLFQQFMFSVRIVWEKGMHNTALIVGNVSIAKRWNCIYPSCYLSCGFLCLQRNDEWFKKAWHATVQNSVVDLKLKIVLK